jgi:GTPase
MVKIIGHVLLYDTGRKSAIKSGYRPIFDFNTGIKTSGKIELIDLEEFFPGSEGIVKITFLNKKYLGDEFSIGSKFFFGEGAIVLGEGIVLEITESV